MKQNQFIQNCMQSYMKNYRHYLTGETKKIMIILFTPCLSAWVFAEICTRVPKYPLGILYCTIGLQYMQRPEAR